MLYFGPFKVVSKIGEMAYKLEFPTYSKIHPIFHIYLLKKFKGDSNLQYFCLPLATFDVDLMLQPEKVPAMRTIL